MVTERTHHNQVGFADTYSHVGRPDGRLSFFVFDPMQRQPMPGFWIAMQLVIVICVLISAVIVIVKL